MGHKAQLPPRVYEKHGAYFLVRGGKWTRLGSTLEEAMVAHGRLVEPSGGMPGLVWRVYQHKLPRLAKSTALAYKTAATKLSAAFSEFEPDQVKPRHVAQLKVSMSATPNMANETVSFLRGVFDYAVEHGITDSNPCLGIKRLEVVKRRRCPSDAELRALHERADDRMRVIIELLVLTGQRVGDVLAIKRSQLTEHGVRFTQQKTGNPLTIRWSPELRATVERAKALGGNVASMYLLSGKRGAPPHYRVLHEQWSALCASCGVDDLHIHDLRAKAVTTAKQQGLDPRAVAGHSSESMTARYIREHDEPLVAGPSFTGVFTV